MLTAADPATPPASAPESVLLKIVAPQARDRWTLAAAKGYTPDRIEYVLRSALSGNLVARWQLFDLMEETWPRLLANLGKLKWAVQSLDWSLQPWAEKGAPPSSDAQRRAALVERALWSMRPAPDADENDFEGALKDILDAWGKGISVLEIDWAAQKFPQFGSVLAPRCTRWIHPRCYGYPPSGVRLMLNTQEAGVSVPAGGETCDGFAPFPESKFLISIARHKSGHPLSGALLRPLAFWWCASNFAAEWLLNFAQIFGVPIRWATYDSNKPGLLDQISEMLENMGSAGWAAFPAGTMLELKEASRSGQDNPQTHLLALADKICDILVLGQTLTSDAGDRGTQALGSVHKEVLDEKKLEAANFAAGVVNDQLIRAICRLNFGDEESLPWLMPSLDPSRDELAMAQRDKTLLDAGVVLPREWFYTRHRIPMPAPGDETLNAASAASRISAAS